MSIKRLSAMTVKPTTATGNATAGDVRATKTFSSDADVDLMGSVPDRGAVIITPSGTNQIAIPDGIHSGSVVSQVSVPANKVLTGTTIAGTAGTMTNNGTPTIVPTRSNITLAEGYYGPTTTVQGVPVDASKVLSGTTIAGTAGTMPNQPVLNAATGHATALNSSAGQYTAGNPNVRCYLMPPAGYYDGATWVAQDQPAIIPSNIASDVTILGVTGNVPKPVYVSLPTPRYVQNFNGTSEILKSAQINVTGQISISMNLGSTYNNGVYAYLFLYKNGLRIGNPDGYYSNQPYPGLAVGLSIAVNAGDVIEVSARAESSSGGATVGNFLITNTLSSPTNASNLKEGGRS
ncbi:hypothetical protein BC351_10615 [Paenibacillus ferrarius]|uniref:Uncharacterized protein n=1 Tax=Paenibacillus ferrarius TaxID=1469647 RepID=A0A1V4H8Z2_9BACL|nr:hypothetical protein [Paenibacillus ferrarius]OPH47633.1 hypothetical protein BC351_10615 [Paenibacillus ferrarius]